ncbi:response regulator [Deltaproteobacteria bacterium TL4]
MSRILVVDDEAQVREMLTLKLTREGYETICASNGEEAIQMFRDQPVDLIITDLLMPGKDGLELIMELRREFQDVNIIAISGGGRGKLLESLKTNHYFFGAVKTFAKPLELNELLAAVREILGE